MFTDTHSHIHFRESFPDVEELIGRAQQKKVTRQIIVGCTPKDSFEALEFVKAHVDLHFWSTLGVHPHNANECTPEILEKFEEIVKLQARTEKPIVAFGEMGLDYFRNFQPKDVQIKAFSEQLTLAKLLDLAVVVHIRDAWEDALKVLAEAGNQKVVLHCFTGDLKIAEQCWDKGYYTSFSGVVTYPKNQYLRDVVNAAPKNKLLIETDCPYLTPQPYRGQRNEPAFVVETARCLAEIKKCSLEEMAQITTQNAQRVFGIS